MLCERGVIAFATKINNVQNGGGIGAILYNNQPGNFSGTCNGSCYATPIPAISLSQAGGQALLPSVGTNSTLIVDDGSSCATCTGGYDYMSGTSMATPAVAAGIAWMWDACGGPTSITNKDLRQLLRDSARDLSGTRQDGVGSSYVYGTGYDVHSGWGLIQLKDALDLGGERFGWQVCPPSGPFVIDPDPQQISVCALTPIDAVYTLDVGGKDFQGDIGLSVTGHPAGTTATFATPTVNVPNAGDWIPTSLTIGNTGVAAAGSYTLNILGVDQADAANTFAVDVQLNSFIVIPGVPTLSAPADGSTGVATPPTLAWTAASQAATYAIDIATDPNFANIVDSAAGLTGTSYTPATTLNGDTVYYWRVRAENACGTGAWSRVNAFSTATVTTCYNALNNSGFESGRDGSWTESAVPSNDALIGQYGVPHSGTWHAFLGYYNRETDDLYQTVAIPNGATASLAYWYRIYSVESNCDRDYAHIRIDGATVRSYGLCTTSATPQYVQSTLDLGAYANGNNHEIRFRATTNANTRSDFYLDDVTLTVCTSSTPVIADYSDLDSSYGIAWHTGNGSLRLGANWSADSTFDRGSDDSDDDGVILFASLLPGELTYIFADVQGTPTGANGWLRGWFDWNYNGIFDTDELAINQAVSAGFYDLPVNVPDTVSGPVNYRFRLYDSATAPMAPMVLDNLSFGAAAGGEVEDGTSPVPTAVKLARFEAVPDGSGIRVEWETATELDNLGFNLYRSESADGPFTQLNAGLIPAQNPGQVLGAVYTWQDESTPANTTLYYKLEDVDIHGVRTFHGPISVNAPGSPNAQTLVGFTAQQNATTYLIPLALLVFASGIMWGIGIRRKQRAR